MRVALLLLASIAGAAAQYTVQDNPSGPQSETSQFDCSSLSDGVYSGGLNCRASFFKCVSGLSYTYQCPDGLVFDEGKGYCEYPDNCGVAHEQPQTPQPTPTSTSGITFPQSSECIGKPDGRYALGSCIDIFLLCSNGQANQMSCPPGLLFDGSNGVCEFADNCGNAVDHGQDVTLSYPGASEHPPFTTTIQASNECYGKPDGMYEKGECLEVFMLCTNGQSFLRSCPIGLVFDGLKGSCQYSADCGVPQDVLPYQPTSPPASSSVAPSHEPINECTGKSDGIYSVGCVEFYLHCVSGIAYRQECPAGLVFNDFTKVCEYSCESTSTERSTTPIIEYSTGTTPSYTSVSSTFSYTVPETLPTHVVEPSTTTEAHGFCKQDSSQAVGDCSTKFRRCRNDRWVDALCPGPTVYDDSLGLCVYDLPRCKTDVIAKPQKPEITYGKVETVTDPAPVSYGSEQPLIYPTYASSYPVWPSHVLSNPFYIKRRHSRHRNGHRRHHSSEEYEGRENEGKLRHASRPAVMRGHHAHVVDAFSHRSRPTFALASVFPRSRVRAISMRKAFDIEDSDEAPVLDDETPVTETPVTETPVTEPPVTEPPVTEPPVTEPPVTETPATEPPVTETPAVDANANGDVEGSGFEDDMGADVGSKRTKRSYSVSDSEYVSEDMGNNCSHSHQFIPLGTCRMNFVYCRGALDAVLAACPVGELFDAPVHFRCVPYSVCGSSDMAVGAEDDIPIIEIVQPTPSPSLSVPTSTSTTTTVMSTIEPSELTPEQLPCSSEILRQHACASTYYVCIADRATRMTCPAGLKYNIVLQICDFPENVNGCPESASEQSTRPEPYVVQPQPHIQPYPDFDSVQSSTPAQHQPFPYKPGTNFDDTHVDATSPELVMNIPYKVESLPSTVAVSVPQEAFEETSTAVSISACSSSENQYMASAPCSSKFFYCDSGRMSRMFTCPDGLIFDSSVQTCLYKENVAACGTAGVYLGPLVDSSTYAASVFPTAPIVASTASWTSNNPGVTTVATRTYSSTVTKHMPECVELTKGIPCSPTYFVCSFGVFTEMTCPEQLVYNNHTKLCDFPHLVPDCDYVEIPTSEEPRTEEPSTPSSLTYGTIVFDPVVITEAPTTVFVDTTVGSTVPITVEQTVVPSTSMATEKPIECDASSKPTPLGLCKLQYLACSAEGRYVEQQCPFGQLFDAVQLKCIVSSSCFQTPSTVQYGSVNPIDVRCTSFVNGNGVASLGACQNNFLYCSNNVATIKNCPGNLVFSNKKRRCVRRIGVPECERDDLIQYPVNDSNQTFCAGRSDAFYSDPTDCAGILMCFGGDTLRMPSCTSGLVFNEKTQKCDYRQNVPSCKEPAHDGAVKSGCDGATHGAYIPDKSDCTVFYRCVWNRLTKMHCPTGTVFNPSFSICDWPANVPECSQQSTPASSTMLY